MIYYSLKTETAILLLLILAGAVSCSSKAPAESLLRESIDTTIKKQASVEILTDSLPAMDSSQSEPKKVVRSENSKKESMPTQERISEIGSTNEKFNGEVILIQLDLPQKNYEENPDVVTNQVIANYDYSKNFFPEDSRGRVASIKLNYRIELFEDAYAPNPYKVIAMSYPNAQ